MRRIITHLGILACICCLQYGGRAQVTSKNATYYDSCIIGPNSAVSGYVYLTNGTPLTSCIVETNWGDGSKLDSTAITSAGSSGSYYSALYNHHYATAGTYTVKHVIVCSGNRIDSLNKTLSAYCSWVYGNLYNDVNNDCTYSPGTEPRIFGSAQIEVDSAGVKVDTIHSVGYWSYKCLATTTTVYKFTLLSNPAGYVRTCPSSNTITLTFTPTLTAIPTQDFGFNCTSTPTYDYKLTYWRALRAASSSGPSYIYLLAQNTTCSAGTGTVTLNVSSKYNVNSTGIYPTPTSVSGNTVVWTVPALSAGYSVMLYVPLTPKSTTNNGDTACNYAVISPTSDLNPANNIISICDSVKSSWDPNEKMVSPSIPMPAGSTLTYTINFENLGNDTAFNIHVQDTLSQYLDANSFVLVQSSHRVSPSIYQAAGKNILKFDFPNINLESKSVPTRNKGQVIFTMKTKTALAPGTSIPNRAGIYFDGNPVVVTNYAYSSTPGPEGVPGIGSKENIKVFPNPAGDVLNIQVSSNGWDEAILTNAVGQTVTHQPLVRGNNTLNVASLPAGIYYLQAKGSAGSFTEKIEKQ
jgi:uncharacterized repeat protein (TIGR01451 family)